MAYALKYQASFDNVAEQRYRMEILSKDYAGDVMPMILSGDPVRHSWQTDEAKSAIKGSSLTLKLLTEENISKSYSARTNFTYFAGESHIFLDNTDADFIPQIGVPFTISGHPNPIVNNTWTPIAVTANGLGWDIRVTDGLFTVDVNPSTPITINTTASTATPILDFYSPNDDQFKGQFYWNEQLLFEGFLVQDDCNEDMVDYLHQITLSFNDNLGLLKDVSLDENVPDFGTFIGSAMLDFVSPVPDNFILLYNTGFVPQAGVPFTLSNHIDPTANATWTPTAVTNLGNGNWQVQVVDLAFLADTVVWPVNITDGITAGNIDLYSRNTLINIIRVCLFNTGLELNTNVYANIFEQGQETADSFLVQTYIDTQTFIKGDGFMDCYSVLSYILERFELTLFQAYGVWNIARWFETRYYPAKDVPFYQYDSDLLLIGTGVLNSNFTTGFEQITYPEVGLNRQIFRPFQYDKETFNYTTPKYLLKNYDLLTLGALLNTYTAGPNTINEYEMTDWFPGTTPPTYYIRIVTDTATGNELARYMVIQAGNLGSVAESVVSIPFEVAAGDKVELSFSFVTNVSQAGTITLVFALRLYDGTTTNYANEDPLNSWQTGPGYSYVIASGDNTNNFHTVTISPDRIPFDGLLYVHLIQVVNTPGPTDETAYRDIRITYTPYINDSTKIIGQIHNTEQSLTIKNNEDVEVFMDDSPRNSIAGTLFLPSFTGLLQNKTVFWYRLINPDELLRIGQIITQEQLSWRLVPRTKLEGTFYGLVQDTHISMLAVLKIVALPTLNFIFGSMEIDYRNNSFNCTQWEICTDDEDENLDGSYTFKYIYSAK